MKKMAALIGLMILLTPVLSFAGSKMLLINSVPGGATVYIDGRKVGVTPVTVEMNRRWWYELSGDKRPFIRAEKAGYQPFAEKLNPSEINMPAVVAGFCCLFPWLWAMELPDTYTLNLLPK